MCSQNVNQIFNGYRGFWCLIFLPLAYLNSIDHWIVSIIYQHSESSGIYVFIFLDYCEYQNNLNTVPQGLLPYLVMLWGLM